MASYVNACDSGHNLGETPRGARRRSPPVHAQRCTACRSAPAPAWGSCPRATSRLQACLSTLRGGDREASCSMSSLCRATDATAKTAFSVLCSSCSPVRGDEGEASSSTSLLSHRDRSWATRSQNNEQPARNLIITLACTVRVASMTFSQLEVSQSARFDP